ncbi:hypothetical protein [Allorhizocola rhizosphaerae]|uniref:hypothetical protein n=1 Tax=Allorhizocola rhizosphaerae TaxID=1872709 RepID=UPI000E3E7C91|nr:hypothetical protein [Allorhizocola rhizosphaerae]
MRITEVVKIALAAAALAGGIALGAQAGYANTADSLNSPATTTSPVPSPSPSPGDDNNPWD